MAGTPDSSQWCLRGLEWALSGQGGYQVCDRGVWVTSLLYTGIILFWFNFLDLGDSLHASTVALHDLPDPFRFYTP